jgi:ankyrin repeat protein
MLSKYDFFKILNRYLKTDPELLNKHDYDKRTALHLAAAEGHIDLVNFIVKKTDVDKGKKDR